MVYCCAVGCQNNTNKGITTTEGGKRLSFFKFPKDPVMKELWIRMVGRTEMEGCQWDTTPTDPQWDWRPSEHSRLCSEHFSADQINAHYPSGQYLRDGAVPNIFPPRQARGKKSKYQRKKARIEDSTSETSGFMVVDVIQLENAEHGNLLRNEAVSLEVPKINKIAKRQNPLLAKMRAALAKAQVQSSPSINVAPSAAEEFTDEKSTKANSLERLYLHEAESDRNIEAEAETVSYLAESPSDETGSSHNDVEYISQVESNALSRELISEAQTKTYCLPVTEIISHGEAGSISHVEAESSSNVDIESISEIESNAHSKTELISEAQTETYYLPVTEILSLDEAGSISHIEAESIIYVDVEESNVHLKAEFIGKAQTETHLQPETESTSHSEAESVVPNAETTSDAVIETHCQPAPEIISHSQAEWMLSQSLAWFEQQTEADSSHISLLRNIRDLAAIKAREEQVPANL